MKEPLSKYGKPALLLILVVAVAALLLVRRTPVRNAVKLAPNAAEQPVRNQITAEPLSAPPAGVGKTAKDTKPSGRAPNVEAPKTNPVSPAQTPANTKSTEATSRAPVQPLAAEEQRPDATVRAEVGRRKRADKNRHGEAGERAAEEERKQDQPDEALKWRMMSMVDETGTIPHNAEMRAWQHAKQMPIDPRAWPVGHLDPSLTVAGINPAGWQWLGPGNIGGRVRSIVIHPTSPQTMWLGSVSGGIWKTTNGGVTWGAMDDFMANLAVSSMVIDPTNPNVLYAGTGEGYFNQDSIQGAGVFKTTNGGTTWTQLAQTATPDWYWVSRLAISPVDNQIILAATRSGIWRSTDGGATWIRKSTQPFMLDADFHPTDGNKAIASGTSGANARYSNDGGLTWNLATGITGQRVEVAYARSNPTIVYASVESGSGQLYRSTDGGQSYLPVSTPNHLNSQGWYDNALWVDPTNSNNVVIGGIGLFRSTNGGTNFLPISGVHADQHIIVEAPGFNGTSNRTVFFGNDGGIYRTTDMNATFPTATELNNNLGITQFYGGAGNVTSGRIIGGTQDNGTLRYMGLTEAWSFMNGGDGGWCASDPTDPNYFYGEFQWLGIHRSSNGGISSTDIYGGIPEAGDFGFTNFISPFILDPNNPTTLLAGAARLWRSTNAKSTTVNWADIKPTTGSHISAIAVANGNSNIIWVGHNNGDVYVTTNGTAASPTWTQVDNNSPGLPSRVNTRLTVDPTNPNRVYATFGGFSADNVWRSDNSGASWTNVTSNLPAAPVRSLVVRQNNPNNLYVGTQVGVFASANGGQSWSPSNDGPTNCSVDELFWMGNRLVAATHGRGMFRINIGTSQLPSVSISNPTTGASFNAGDNVMISATANDPDGMITRVDFFAGSTPIGTATTAPYTVTWNNVPGGLHQLTARATDNSGDDEVSASVNINVTGGGGCTSAPISIGQTINGSLATTDCQADDGSYYDFYFFNASAGQEVALSMSSGSFDTFLILIALDGNFVASDDDGGGATNSRIPSGVGFVTLPTTGTYTILANSFSSGVVGSYSLTLAGGAAPGPIQLSSVAYSVGEGGGAASVTVTRTGSTGAAATVNYATSDPSGLNNCSFINGVASARCDYIQSVGTVRFAIGETAKNISIPIVDDSYAEGSEPFTITLSNASGAALGSPNTATVTIQDNEATNGANPIDLVAFFVRQQYLDFLNREPDPAGYAAWQAVINNCLPNDITCDRIHVSSSFFRSAEFQGRGYFVYRFYPVAFGRKPDYDEFTPDIAKVSGFLSDAELEAAKVAFIAEFMSRPAFVNTYNGLSNTAYVDLLLATAGITHPARDFWIAALDLGTRTRAQVLREIAESTEVYNKYFNQAFVVMQYFGYLRRQPDGQYIPWIQHLDSTGDFRSMINGFMNSAEYRARFGP